MPRHLQLPLPYLLAVTSPHSERLLYPNGSPRIQRSQDFWSTVCSCECSVGCSIIQPIPTHPQVAYTVQSIKLSDMHFSYLPPKRPREELCKQESQWSSNPHVQNLLKMKTQSKIMPSVETIFVSTHIGEQRLRIHRCISFSSHFLPGKWQNPPKGSQNQ